MGFVIVFGGGMLLFALGLMLLGAGDWERAASAATNEHRRLLDEQGRMLVEFRAVSMPPPSPRDYQVSAEDGPDFDINHFSGGIERIWRTGDLLTFQFANGGRVCVPNAVTYHAPETH